MPLLDSFTVLLSEQFRHTTWPEWLGVATGFTCIYLAAKERVLSWPVSIISVLCYAWVFFDARMYGDMALQFYFLFTAFYGWYYWVRKKEEHQQPVSVLGVRQWLAVIIAVLLLSGILGLFLYHFTDSDVPYADSFCTAVSFVAQVLLTRKILENWLLWIFVDICYIPLYVYKSLNLSAVFYAFLVVIAIKGYLDWKNTYREQTR